MKKRPDLFDNIVLKIIVILFSFLIPLNISKSINWEYNNTMLWVSGFVSCLICNLIDLLSSFGGYMESNYNKVIYKGKYFIVSEEIIENKKTPILYIHSIEGYYLGYIKYYNYWKKFCFYPEGETILDEYYMNELVDFLVKYNINWRKKNHEE